MAEIEKVSPNAQVVTAAADIPTPIASPDAGGTSVEEYGASPNQERSSTSYAHDSEYDTASDLEGGDEYDDDDDEDLDDESITDGESITDDELCSQEKAELEAQKKVDEDRSNPQYIPKKGTFYEHDDRTVEFDAGVVNTGESGEVFDGIGTKPSQSPTILHASKTMKKWQPASAVERWAHDRFDASEQAPKSRSELVSAYGYDIRTEDAPPRARRRRRYGRGPSKYSRNWEDESAYLKASNKERKPPRASDFPALNERNIKSRKIRITREEKENRMEKRAVEEKLDSSRSFQDERCDIKDCSKSQKMGRQSNQSTRQAPMEFKQKQRNSHTQSQGNSNSSSVNRNDIQQNDRQGNRPQNQQSATSVNEQNQRYVGKTQGSSRYPAREPHVVEGSYAKTGQGSNNSSIQNIQSHKSQNQQAGSTRQQPLSKTTHTSNLSQRLQQVQNRNDPSHVGSVQMHALATQNQLTNQQQQLNSSVVLNSQQHSQQTSGQQLSQEQRGPPKRYSSLRRSQHEAQHIAEQLQHMHLQQQQPSPIIMQDQHMIQTNLMQIYHQENLQAQIQVLQTNQSPGQQKQQSYSAVPTGTQPSPYASNTSPAATQAAYFVAPPDTYGVAATANGQPQPNPQYAQQPTNYLPPSQASTTAPMSYSSGPPSSQSPVTTAVPSTYGAGVAVQPQSAAATTGPTNANGNPNYQNYQNYNTVGGTTYFVPPAQATPRPVVLPQRRPTNAIPILPPSEKNKLRSSEIKEEGKAGNTNSMSQQASQSTAPIGSAENIDHIIDNMFVQRPAFQPPQPAAPHQNSTIGNVENISEDMGSIPMVIPPDDKTVNSVAIGENANNCIEDNSIDTSNNSSAPTKE